MYLLEKGIGISGPLVIDKSDKEKLAFGLKKDIKTVADVEKYKDEGVIYMII